MMFCAGHRLGLITSTDLELFNPLSLTLCYMNSLNSMVDQRFPLLIEELLYRPTPVTVLLKWLVAPYFQAIAYTTKTWTSMRMHAQSGHTYTYIHSSIHCLSA